MGIVFDEVEGVIEPRETREVAEAQPSSQVPADAAECLSRVMRELEAQARRAARLRAD